jgi:hypothetical protein
VCVVANIVICMFTTRTHKRLDVLCDVFYMTTNLVIHVVVKDTFWRSAWIPMLELVEKIKFLATRHGYHIGLQD